MRKEKVLDIIPVVHVPRRHRHHVVINDMDKIENLLEEPNETIDNLNRFCESCFRDEEMPTRFMVSVNDNNACDFELNKVTEDILGQWTIYLDFVGTISMS